MSDVSAPPTGKRAAVLGSPIAHSLSPRLHSAAYRALGLTGWTYDRYDVTEDALPSFLDRLSGPWAGLSLTMPLKRAVIPLLDQVSGTAAAIEAVNTVVFTDDGRRLGDNTDVPGIVAALRERGVERIPGAALLGAGATASSALAAIAPLCDGEITVYVTRPARAAEMHRAAARLGVEITTAEWSEAAGALEAPLVIATTPAGATDALAAAVPDRPGLLFDVLYDPWPTRLAAAWERRGGQLIGGLDLLVHQAVLQVQQMTGVDQAPLEAMRRAGEAALAARQPDES